MKKISLLLSCALLFISVLSACGGGSGATNTTQSATAGAETTSLAATANNTTESSGAGDAQASETDEPIEFTIFIDHTWFWFNKYDDLIAKEITKLTGVSLDVTRATESTQLPVMIASGDLPDLVYTSANGTITLLCDPDVSWPYNELVEKTGADLNANAIEVANNIRPDGNYYALLNAYTSQEAIDSGNTLVSGGTNSLAYRKDIYEELGSPPLDTLDDLENMLLAAKEAHPDIIPLLNDPGYIRYFMGQMGMQTSDIQFADDNKVIHRINNPRLIEYYSMLNRFSREGLISAEAQTYNYDKFMEVRNSGLTFMQLRSSGEAMEANNNAVAIGSDYRWKLLTHELSPNALFTSTGIGWSGLFITKNCKDPDRAIRYMAWMRSDEGRQLTSWGIKGEHWDYNSDGETIRTASYQKAMEEGKLRQDDFGIGVWIFGDKGDEAAFIDHSATDEVTVDNIERLRSAVSHYKVLSDLYFCIPVEGDMLSIYTKLNDMIVADELKVIFADTEAEMQAAFDAMIDKSKQIGVAELEEWMNQVHNERLAITQ